MSAFSDLIRGGFWRRVGAMIRKEFVQLRRDRITFATIVTIAADAARAVRLCHQHPAARIADRGAAAGIERRRALDPQGAGKHQILQDHAAGARRDRVRPRAGLGRGVVCDRDSARLRARAPPRRPAGAADCGRRHRSGGDQHGARRAEQHRNARAPQRPRHPRQQRAAVRDPHPRPLQPGRIEPAQHRARPDGHDPDLDHADLHRAVGDARDRARHHGKPCCRCRSRRSRSCSARSCPMC